MACETCNRRHRVDMPGITFFAMAPISGKSGSDGWIRNSDRTTELIVSTNCYAPLANDDGFQVWSIFYVKIGQQSIDDSIRPKLGDWV